MISHLLSAKDLDRDDAAVDAFRRDLGRSQGARRVQVQVVAVHRHVNGPDGYLPALSGADPGCEAPGQQCSAGRDAQDHQVVGASGVFDDLVGDAGESPVEVGGVEDDGADGATLVGAGQGDPHGFTLLRRLSGRIVKGTVVSG